MREQALAFQQESAALHALLAPLAADEWLRKTQFKDWTVHDVIAHLHIGNYLAGQSLSRPDDYRQYRDERRKATAEGVTMRAGTDRWLNGLDDLALLQQWHETSGKIAQAFTAGNPSQRVPWAGPDMSARSSISARLMETWAHGQALYDLLGKQRVDSDGIRNIVTLGVNTFGWTFSNRGLEVPPDRPRLQLAAPSGEVWSWEGAGPDTAGSADCIEGAAVEFCQVVTQVRNIADTSLQVHGPTATRWMAIAQCFAGPPNDPPLPGTRFMQT